MKKILSCLLALSMLFGVVGVAAAAPANDSEVMFFIQVNGNRMDTNGKIASQDVAYFTGLVAKSELAEKRNTKDAISIGEDPKTHSVVTEQDILSLLTTVPDDEDVFARVLSDFRPKGYIKATTGEVIPWAALNTNNYKSEWYVLKYEKSDGWHIDGCVIDIRTNKAMAIVVPEDPKDIPEEAYDPNPEYPETEEVKALEIEEEEKAPVEEEKAEVPAEEEKTEAPAEEEKTEAPAEEEKAEVPAEEEKTEAPAEDNSISLENTKYAYIFGYEPIIRTDENGNQVAEISMGMEDDVTFEQVCTMFARLLDSAGITDKNEYPITDLVRPHSNQWYTRGLSYMESKGGLEASGINLGPVTRGQVAKLVACALDLNLTTTTEFNDIADCQYKSYIEKVNAYGYMNGVSGNKFAPNKTLTRAEFCQLINNIIGRDDSYKLIANDENGEEITAETYSFIDMNPSHWAYETCLKATSCFNDKGYVDLSARKSNIRNTLDVYEDQKDY